MYDESMSDDFSESQGNNQNSQGSGQSQGYGNYRNPGWQPDANRGNYQGGGNYNGGQRNNGSGYRNNYGGNGGGYNNNRSGNGGYNRGGGGGFQRRPFNNNQQQPREFDGVAKVYISYAVASNENVPANVIEEFKSIIPELEKAGFILRVSAMKNSIDDHVRNLTENKEVILPWRGFNEVEDGNTYTSPETKAIAKLFQPGYDSLSKGVQLIVAKNVRLALGNDSRSPVNFVLCWSEDGAETNATKTSATGVVGHLIAVASAAHIPVYNLGNTGCLERLKRNLNIGTTNEQQKKEPSDW